MAQVVAISTGAVFQWNAATVGRVVDYSIRGLCNPVDTTAQESGNWREFIAGKRSFEISVGIQLDEADAVHLAIQTDFGARTPRVFAFTTFPDGTGFTGTAMIARNPITEHYADLVKLDLALHGSEPLETTNYGNTGSPA